MPTAMENYLFDLRGYLVLKGAVAPEHVQRINQAIDGIPPLKDDEWYGRVQGHTYHGGIDGINLQNIVEGGEPFEELIARLTPERAKILQPVSPRRPPGSED